MSYLIGVRGGLLDSKTLQDIMNLVISFEHTYIGMPSISQSLSPHFSSFSIFRAISSFPSTSTARARIFERQKHFRLLVGVQSPNCEHSPNVKSPAALSKLGCCALGKFGRGTDNLSMPVTLPAQGKLHVTVKEPILEIDGRNRWMKKTNEEIEGELYTPFRAHGHVPRIP